MTDHIDQNSTTIGRVLAVGVGLLAFGLAFDRLTGFVNKQPWGEERSAFLVVAGVSVTVLLRRMLPLGTVLWDFFAFACSGAPMIVGQHMRLERRNRAALRRHLGRNWERNG